MVKVTVGPSPVVRGIVTVSGSVVAVVEIVVVEGMVVVKKHVGRGIGYFEVQNDCAPGCFASGVKNAKGSLEQYAAVALALRKSSANAKTV